MEGELRPVFAVNLRRYREERGLVRSRSRTPWGRPGRTGIDPRLTARVPGPEPRAAAWLPVLTHQGYGAAIGYVMPLRKPDMHPADGARDR